MKDVCANCVCVHDRIISEIVFVVGTAGETVMGALLCLALLCVFLGWKSGHLT